MGWFLYDNGLRHERVKKNNLYEFPRITHDAFCMISLLINLTF